MVNTCVSFLALLLAVTSLVTDAWSVAFRRPRFLRSGIQATSRNDDDVSSAPTLWSKDFVQQTTDNALVSYYQSTDPQLHNPLAPVAAQATYRWAAHFVVPHKLCPWAERSVTTKDALQIMILTYSDDLDLQLEAMATEFHERVDSGRADPNTAILFCVIMPPQQQQQQQHQDQDQHWTADFPSFYDWYLDLEETWFDRADENESHVANHVTLAPFHPHWQFASDENDDDSDDSATKTTAATSALQQSMEKMSPFPTITMVATGVIERAGEAATQQIFSTNQKTMASKSMEEWTQLYQHAVYGETDSSG